MALMVSQGTCRGCETRRVQRSLAGILFLLASVAFSLAVSGWWLQRAAFSPNTNGSQTEAILDDTGIRMEITTVVAFAAAPALGQSPNDVAAFVDSIIGSHAGAAVMTDIVNEAHRRILGDHPDPVTIDGEQLVQIVRDERAADVAAITLPVPEIGTLEVLRNILRWLVPIGAGLGVLLTLLAFVTRPERREVVRALGELGIALGVGIAMFGYLVPVHLVPSIDDSAWTQAVPRLALRSVAVVIGAAAVLAIAGLAMILTAANSGRRKQWSTPLSLGRYREDRSWS
jgi:hypothetical protein